MLTTTAINATTQQQSQQTQQQCRRIQLQIRICVICFYVFVSTITIFVCPYTKVEESFNVQGTHDLLYYGYHTNNNNKNHHHSDDTNSTSNNSVFLFYDHLKYPGVVPRTFTGPIFLSTVVQIVRYTIQQIITKGDGCIDIVKDYPFLMQCFVRWILLLIMSLCLYEMSIAIDTYYYDNDRCYRPSESHKKKGKKQEGSTKHSPEHDNIDTDHDKPNYMTMIMSPGIYFLIITSCQFHSTYYSSRLLPNIFATLFTIRSYTHWLYYLTTLPSTSTSISNNNTTTPMSSSLSPSFLKRFNIFSHMNFSLLHLCIALYIFRCDILLLIGCLIIQWLLLRHVTIVQGIVVNLFFGICILPITIWYDTFLWGRSNININTIRTWMWPEVQVFYFNVILNQSSNYGVMPYFWYYTNALPKLLLGTCFFLPIALVRIQPQQDQQEIRISSQPSSSSPKPTTPTTTILSLVRCLQIDTMYLQFFIPAFGYIVLYSSLGHKEVRFLYPIVPLLNLLSSIGLYKIQLFLRYLGNDTRTKSSSISTYLSLSQQVWMKRIIIFGCSSLLLLSFFMNCTFTMVSKYNYPGGTALQLLTDHVNHQPKVLYANNNNKKQQEQEHVSSPNQIHVYIDNEAAMTGVSLFIQRQAQQQKQQQHERNMDPKNHIQWIFHKDGYEMENQNRIRKVDWKSLYTHLIMNIRDVKENEDNDTSTTYSLLNDYKILYIVQGQPKLNIKKGKIDTFDTIAVLQRKGPWNTIIRSSSSGTTTTTTTTKKKMHDGTSTFTQVVPSDDHNHNNQDEL